MIDMAPWLILLALAAMVAAGLVPTGTADAAPRRMARVMKLASAGVLAGAVVVAAAHFLSGQPLSLALSGPGGIGIGVHVDGLSAIMAVLVAFIGLVVTSYSRAYMDGDPGQGRFFKWLGLTLAAVMMLILSGNLAQLAGAWIATSLCLHQLLLFYPDRPAARIAARKKEIVSRLGDVAMLCVLVLAWTTFGSVDFATIFPAVEAMREAGSAPAAVHGMALLLAAAALLKSAQVPWHGWLTEVMETPTPVSALLHAGIINAGGFLVLRLSDVMVLSGPALAVLAVVGGLTALIASLVMLTQTAVKGALAWSTIAQMGFMLLQCGLGAFSAALLHIVAHSLYKAHAFLSAGSIVEVVRANAAGPAQTPAAPARLGAALAVAVAMAWAAGSLFGTTLSSNPGAFVLGAVLAMGLAHLMARHGTLGGPWNMGRSAALAGGVALVYFALQSGVAWISADSLAAAPEAGIASLILAGLVTLGFALAVLLQNAVAGRAAPEKLRALRVHLRNGLYIDTVFSRIVTKGVEA